MVDNVVLETPPVKEPPKVSLLSTDKEALFNSIAKETAGTEGGSENASFKAFFTGLLWFGYAIAIGVACTLVWSAFKELMKTVPH